jgi:hypothetical protein
MKTTSIPTRDHLDYRGRRYVTTRSGHLATTDTLLSAGKILHAEEVPPISNRGSRWTGEGNPENDLDSIADGMSISLSRLSASDRQKIWDQLVQCDANGWKVDGIGAVTSDDSTAIGNGIAIAMSRMSSADRAKIWNRLKRNAPATNDMLSHNRASSAIAARMNEDGAKFWEDRARRNMNDADSSRPRLNTTTVSLTAAMNAEARRFYNQDPPHG